MLADFEDPERAGVLALDSIGFLPEESDTGSLGGLRRARVFAGYAGWSAGQLEAEMAEDSWHATPALPARRVHAMTRRACGRPRWGAWGPDFRLLATMPLDPTLN